MYITLAELMSQVYPQQGAKTVLECAGLKILISSVKAGNSALGGQYSSCLP